MLTAAQDGPAPFTVVSPYRPWGASYRVRVQAWLDRLGIPCRPIALGRRPRSQDGRRLTLGDAAYEACVRGRSVQRHRKLLIQKEASRMGSGAVESRLIRRADMVVYDLDDAVFLAPAASPGGRRPHLGARHLRARTLLKGADRVIAGNEYLAEEAARYCADVRLIPTCVDLNDYIPRGAKDERDGPVVVGWLGSASTEAYLEPLWRVLARLQARYDVEVRVIGSGPPRFVARSGCLVDHRPWSLATQAVELSELDVGLAPLPDTPWARGKCGYKLLQYAAAGVVPVGSPVGVAGQILAGAGSPEPTTLVEWAGALETLIGDREERERLGARAREFVRDNYTYDGWEPAWRATVGA